MKEFKISRKDAINSWKFWVIAAMSNAKHKAKENALLDYGRAGMLALFLWGRNSKTALFIAKKTGETFDIKIR